MCSSDRHMGIESTKALILLVKLSPYHEQALIAGGGDQCLMERGMRGEEFQRRLAVFSEARRGRPQLVLGSDQPAFPFDSAALNREAAGNRLDVAAQVGQLLEVGDRDRSDAHTFELQSLMRLQYAGFC